MACPPKSRGMTKRHFRYLAKPCQKRKGRLKPTQPESQGMRHPRDSKQERVNMRYRNDKDKKKRRCRKKNGKSTQPKSTSNYFSINATVLTSPRHECTVFRGSQLRQEITVNAVIHSKDNSSRYPLRFTNKATHEMASKLRPGDKIRLTKCRFDYRHKRAETELRVYDMERGCGKFV